MGLQRQFNRHGHDHTMTANELEAWEKRKKPLDVYNESLSPGQTMHATKGLRKRSVFNMRASIATLEQRRGKVPYTIFTMSAMRNFLRSGIWKGSNIDDR